MKRRLLYIVALLLFPGLSAVAQEDLLDRILSVNVQPSLKADFTQKRHSPMLTEDIVSEGTVYLQQPDKIRWETVRPVRRTSVFNGEISSGRQFRLPGRKDFTVTEITGNKHYYVTLIPVRNDLKRLFTRIVLIVRNDSLLIEEIQLFGNEGDYTILSFKDIKFNVDIDPSLFEKG